MDPGLSTPPLIGIIGGSGLYDIDGLANTRWARVPSPFGEASDELLFGELNGIQMVFLSRHGRGHRIPPTEINFRANIDVLKRAGVTDVISISAVGSLREDLTPGMFVIVDQFIDRTISREKSFFGTGMVAHVSMAHPVCGRLGHHLEESAREAGIEFVRGGTYLVMEGPQFSSQAESEMYRSWNCDVIGMTNMPEAKLAREAEMCYATVAMVTDFDCWHPTHDAVEVSVLLEVMEENRGRAQRLFGRLARDFPAEHTPCPVGSDRALEGAILTRPEARDPELVEKLRTIAGRVLGRG